MLSLAVVVLHITKELCVHEMRLRLASIVRDDGLRIR